MTYVRTPEFKTFHSGYMSGAWDFETILAAAQKALKGKRYDTLVGIGLSGAIVVPRLAASLGKHALIIRKPNDGSHSWLPAEGTLGHRWIFVDDFIDTGATYNRVKETVANLTEDEFTTEYVGDFLYNTGRFEAAPGARAADIAARRDWLGW